MRRRLLSCTAALGILLVVSGCVDGRLAVPPVDGATPSATSPAATDSALKLLGTLAVKGRGPKTGYSREQYGPAWADTNRNGCDTRNDILKRDLTSPTFKRGTAGCVVLTGMLADPYTRRAIAFVRGGASEVDIDHVVALANSWVTGAAPWPFKKRLAFANDPLNLFGVESAANRQKGAGDAATWLPANKSFRCAYLARQVAVKSKYHLWVAPAEKAAMSRVLRTCPTEAAPTSGEPTIAPINPPAP